MTVAPHPALSANLAGSAQTPTQRDDAPIELSTLRLPTPPVPPDTCVIDVAQLFLDADYAGLLSLPIVAADGAPVGMISRYELMRVFLQPYGRELFGRRPISVLMNRAPLVLSIETSIGDAARAIARHIRSPITDDFILVENGRYVGTALVLDVLRAVEGRLADRSTELERAYVRLKSSQAQLVQSEKMASLGQMVAGLVHEINTPLGYVRNNVEMTRGARRCFAVDRCAAGRARRAARRRCRRRRAGVPRRSRNAAFARRSGRARRHRRAARRHAARRWPDRRPRHQPQGFQPPRPGGAQKADLNHLVASALKIANHILRKRGIEVVHQPGELPPVECAPAQINQVLLNLLTNAAQAIEHERGRIVVATRAVEGRAMVLIQDNGKGIAAENQARIFDPFFTTKPVGEGTGMGLAISRQIIEQHGGAIRMTSSVGQGTRFVVVLPLRAVVREAA
jgi:signal transduction histidine kinase